MFNPMIWYRVPKHAYVGLLRDTFATGVYDAVAHCNIGNLATFRKFKSLGIESGTSTILGYSALNKNKDENAKCHDKTTFKSRQQVLSRNRK